MTSQIPNKLKLFYETVSDGKPITTTNLSDYGISKDMASYYSRTGWLTRLSFGIYTKPGAVLDMNESIGMLQAKIPGLHVGSISALMRYGIIQQPDAGHATQLYSWDTEMLPEWFTERFNCEIKRKRIFDENPSVMLNVGSFDNKKDSVRISEPERAVLEMLSEVGLTVTIQEAEEALRSTGVFSLRTNVTANMLRRCNSVKAVRLFLMLTEKLGLPIFDEIKGMELPVGSDSDWVWKQGDTVMVLKGYIRGTLDKELEHVK